MDYMFLLTQGIGAIGYTLLSVSYYKKNKKEILFIQIFSYIFFTIHYYMLSGKTGALCNFLGLIAFIIIYLFDKFKVKNKTILTILLIPFLINISLITYENIFSIFPIIASCVVIISFLSNNENFIRGIGLIAAVCWLIYAVVYKSYVAIVFEVITLIATIVAFVKYIRIKKEKTEENKSKEKEVKEEVKE